MTYAIRSDVGKALDPLIRGICYHKDDIQLEERIVHGKVSLYYTVHMADIRLLIGRGAKQVKAIRYLLKAIGLRSGRTIGADFKESYVGQPGEREFHSNPDVSTEEVLEVLMPLAELVFGKKIETRVINLPDRMTIVLDVPPEENGLAIALSDAFWPFGCAKGKKIRIWAKEQASNAVNA